VAAQEHQRVAPPICASRKDGENNHSLSCGRHTPEDNQLNLKISGIEVGGFMQITYPAIFYPWDGGQGFTVEVPDLPGCVSEGRNLPEAIFMGADAASGWILDELEDGKTAPEASSVFDIHPDKGGFVSMLVLDIDAYAEKYSAKAVRKSLTIPAWLNTFAEKKRLNFSKILKESLTAMYQQSQKVS
jgi:predicted RNase H-like HicB family nuclease